MFFKSPESQKVFVCHCRRKVAQNVFFPESLVSLIDIYGLMVKSADVYGFWAPASEALFCIARSALLRRRSSCSLYFGCEWLSSIFTTKFDLKHALHLGENGLKDKIGLKIERKTDVQWNAEIQMCSDFGQRPSVWQQFLFEYIKRLKSEQKWFEHSVTLA